MREILMVIDMQNDFVDGALGTSEAVHIVDKVVAKIQEFDGEIIVTYDSHLENYMETREGKYLPIPHCIKGTKGWELNAKVQEALDKKGEYKTIHKPTFGSTELINLLKGCTETDTKAILIGLCTDICVVSNAMLLKANYPEMDIVVDAKCCAGVTVEKHLAALEVMKSCQIEVINE
ncbi:MAG: cysteine hydrolase [Lachnospiraceae bacterium]|nr:cysteine hydrolase [Lachnospiraceae bacterium]